MNKRVQLYVDESLEQELKKIKDDVSKKMKDLFSIEDIEVRGQVASKIAAVKLSNEKQQIPFKIEKTGINKGYIKIL